MSEKIYEGNFKIILLKNSNKLIGPVQTDIDISKKFEKVEEFKLISDIKQFMVESLSDPYLLSKKVKISLESLMLKGAEVDVYNIIKKQLTRGNYDVHKQLTKYFEDNKLTLYADEEVRL